MTKQIKPKTKTLIFNLQKLVRESNFNFLDCTSFHSIQTKANSFLIQHKIDLSIATDINYNNSNITFIINDDYNITLPLGIDTNASNPSHAVSTALVYARRMLYLILFNTMDTDRV